jgi:hypothetical protein
VSLSRSDSATVALVPVLYSARLVTTYRILVLRRCRPPADESDDWRCRCCRPNEKRGEGGNEDGSHTEEDIEPKRSTAAAASEAPQAIAADETKAPILPLGEAALVISDRGRRGRVLVGDGRRLGRRRSSRRRRHSSSWSFVFVAASLSYVTVIVTVTAMA